MCSEWPACCAGGAREAGFLLEGVCGSGTLRGPCPGHSSCGFIPGFIRVKTQTHFVTKCSELISVLKLDVKPVVCYVISTLHCVIFERVLGFEGRLACHLIPVANPKELYLCLNSSLNAYLLHFCHSLFLLKLVCITLG